MEARLNYAEKAPHVRDAMLGLEKCVELSGLEKSLLNLVRIRASQINGCAWCLDMHTRDARYLGEREQRINLLPAWRDAPFYSDRERAALEWTEALTLVSDHGVPDSVFGEVRKHFSETELAELSLAIIAINGWNRLNIAFRVIPGDKETNQKREAQKLKQ
ncbi:MAG: carboxymuconolactone decarboxylase family protein [Thermoplasmata archaeon]|nr:carboxymuconolactone decarboxylase family protein [Candidatus Sysuiplasma jiujiangense]